MVTSLTSFALSAELTLERQRDIIERFMIVNGQSERSVVQSAMAGIDEDHPIKCGTPDILAFYDNYDRLDKSLLSSMGVQAVVRPSLSYFYDTPGGRIRIHYSTTPPHAVPNPGIDSDGDGVPDYVEDIARISDSVYNITVTVMGYPSPLSDVACANGGDDRVDIYLRNLGGSFYGLTYVDTACATDGSYQYIPSWVEIENDYSEPGFAAYQGRPLDAARVTIAHEFFHTIHFSIDALESREFYEMTAVWMEEEQYDDINDYYSLLPIFYNNPRISLQMTDQIGGLHQYASMVWPLYLSEKYSPEIIRDIWIESGNLGAGPSWLYATNNVLDSVTNSSKNLAHALQEFAVWNYFTGRYYNDAPSDTLRFEEGEAYPSIPFTVTKIVDVGIGLPKDTVIIPIMDVRDTYPIFVNKELNPLAPQPNAATYVRFENIQGMSTYNCDSVIIDTSILGTISYNCVDSTLDTNSLDSLFIGLETATNVLWGVTIIGQLEDIPDSNEIFAYSPIDTSILMAFDNLMAFKSLTVIASAATIDPSYFTPLGLMGFGYFVYDSTATYPRDSSTINIKTALLTPYPNPAIVVLMDNESVANNGKSITFRFELATDSIGDFINDEPFYLVDIFTVAGERVRSFNADDELVRPDRATSNDYYQIEIPWNMKNDAGLDVNSGVYIVYIRLFTDRIGKELIAEERTKVAIIR